MIDQLLSILSSCRLFSDLPVDTLRGLLESAGAKIENYTAGNIVRQQGDSYDALIIVAEGSLEARIDDSTGRGMTVEHFRAPSPVATAVLISSDPVLPVTLLAGEKVTLVTIKTEAILDILTREPSVLKAYLADAGDKVRFLAEKVRLLRFGTLRQRIAGHLLALAREQKTDNPVWRYSREQTADLLGVARPSLSRELSMMLQEGLIETMDRSNVRIFSTSLKQLLEEK
jgi:CRP-like cAMP-binding protein